MMMNSEKKTSEKLMTLLAGLPPNTSQSRASLCEQALRTGAAAYHTTGPVPINEIRDIYGSRAHRNAQRGGPIQGFKELLIGLGTQDVALVLIHSVQAFNKYFLAFTDPSVSKLLGLLELPPATAQADAAETPQTAAAHAA